MLTCKWASRHSGVQFFCFLSSQSGPRPSCFYILPCKCASRSSGVQIFHIWTSKSGPNLVCFVHFHLKMYFVLQRRAIFRHPNIKKWSENVSSLACSLVNVLLATAACNCSTSQLQKVAWSWCILYILTLKCASRYSGISPLNSYLRTRRFREPTFRPHRPTNHWKNTACRDSSNISHGCSFFLRTFAHLCIFFLPEATFSDSASLLCFSSFHIVGS